MASLASDQSWLLNPSIIKQVHQCRRLIQLEFGIKVHLTEEDLVHQLEHFADQSRSTTLPRVWSALKQSVPALAEQVRHSRESTHKMYRGQPVLPEGPAGSPDSASTPRTVIYRGRVVTR
ncbi:hypothetical protein [Marinobacter sp.]|uniref:hypothetical protein n=1 Tax=Marinobacter sp. TaxID=50741 RepID=UPI003566F33E